MKTLVDFLVDVFGYDGAVIVKNFIIGIGLYIVGCFRAIWGVSIILPYIKFDSKHNLLEEDITMLTIINGKRKRIIMPKEITPPQLFLNFFILFLNTYGILRRKRISKKERRTAKLFLIFIAALSLFIVAFALYLCLTVMDNYI